MKLKKMLEISIIKTLYFNFHYFGFKGMVKPVVIIARKVKLKKVQGRITTPSSKTKRIWIGFGFVGVVDKKYNQTVYENSGEIVFLGSANIGYASRIVNKGKLIFGDNFSANAAANFICYKNISFGEDCLLSWNTTFMDTDFHIICDENGKRINEDKEIEVGNHVWIGCNSIVLKGASIASGFCCWCK